MSNKIEVCTDKSYANQSTDNDFLRALAEFGHQVGGLAKTLLGQGIEITETDHDAAEAKTNELLAAGDCLLFEAAVRWENCFVRIDLLPKIGNEIRIYEVKAKSFDHSKGMDQVIGKRVGLLATFKPYVIDVAFQRYVVRKAHPGLKVSSSLVFVNKRGVSPEPVLQRLRINRDGRRVAIDIDPSLADGASAKACLTVIDADSLAETVETNRIDLGAYAYSFEESIDTLMKHVGPEYLAPRAGPFCKKCEFWATPEDLVKGLRDARSECIGHAYGITQTDQRNGTILDLHAFRRFDAFATAGNILLQKVEETYFDELADETKISSSQRQWLQCLEARGEQIDPFVMKQALAAVMATARYPLHFIDFETCRPALPLHGGRRPYEQILFQFSHHRMEESGELCHANEHLYAPDRGFPNYDAVRALKSALGDAGTVVHWWHHEHTVLKEVKTQLQNDTEPPADASDLIAFIDSLVGNELAAGRLFDSGRATEKYVFLPFTRGSSSLKKFLPALLRLVDAMKQKYAQPVYGTDKLPSKIFAIFSGSEQAKTVLPSTRINCLVRSLLIQIYPELMTMKTLKSSTRVALRWLHIVFSKAGHSLPKINWSYVASYFATVNGILWRWSWLGRRC